jgi:AcrR family transcriptional regulator
MGSSAPEQLTPRAREIVAAARELLEAEGPDGLSMRRIAQRLGIKAPSIYKHLPDKQALEAALISAGFEEWAEAFEAALRGADDPLAGLVLSAPHRVERLIVGGEDVVRGGALVRADEQEIAREHRKQARRLVV